MNRDFNNSSDLTDIYNSINTTNLSVSLIPTKLDIILTDRYNNQLYSNLDWSLTLEYEFY